MGNTLSNDVGFIWLAKVNATGTPISRKSIPLPNLKLHNTSRPVVKDMLLLGDQIYALLECEDNRRLAGTTKLMLLQLRKDGLVVTNHPLRLKAINAQLLQVDSESVWVIGQNKSDQQLLVHQVSLKHPELETSIETTPSNIIAANGVLKSILPIEKERCLLLIECYNSILDRQLQILSLSLSGQATVIAPPFDGSEGILSQFEKTLCSLVYKAPSIREVGNDSFKYYSDGHVQVYDLASSTLCYDESFSSARSAPASASFPVFGIDNEKIVANMATTNQLTEKTQYLSPQSYSISISRQYSKGPLHYLLVKTVDWKSSKQKGQISHNINLQMIKNSND
jgi:hypothetical protein